MQNFLMKLLMATCFAIVLAAPGARADSASDGLKLAEEKCARCHGIGKADTSRHPDAPVFREIVKRYPPDSLAEALAEGIVVGHPDMPVFTLSVEELNGLIAYLETL